MFMKHHLNQQVPFMSFEAFKQQLQHLPLPDKNAEYQARKHNGELTKPAGSLGKLESLVFWYASWRGHTEPARLLPQILIFAGNHGVAQHGVSAYPSEVTAQMVTNFNAGGAAINQLAIVAQADLDVIPLSLSEPTADITKGAAMTEDECIAAIAAGWLAVDPDAELVIVGEMGIGNTTSAAAICLALYGGEAKDWVGIGTGIEIDQLQSKQAIVDSAVNKNGPFNEHQGLEILSVLGGRELAAMAGAIVRSRILRIPVILDGFVCCAAAACLQSVTPDSLTHTVAGHVSAEKSHYTLLKNMNKPPILDLGLRLGEGSGAAVAVHILSCALACHSGMATFDQAGVTKE